MIFFFWIRKASTHDFADDNTPSSFARSIKLLLEILIAESKNAIKWFSDNKTIVNPTNLNPLLFKKAIKQSNQYSFL